MGTDAPVLGRAHRGRGCPVKPWEALGLLLAVVGLLVFVGGLVWACLSDADARDCGVKKGGRDE